MAKSARLEAFAESQNCSIFNLSTNPVSNLIFRRTKIRDLSTDFKARKINNVLFDDIQLMEKDIGYFVNDGKYWKSSYQFDQAKLDLLDDLWIKVIDG